MTLPISASAKLDRAMRAYKLLDSVATEKESAARSARKRASVALAHLLFIACPAAARELEGK